MRNTGGAFQVLVAATGALTSHGHAVTAKLNDCTGGCSHKEKDDSFGPGMGASKQVLQ